MSGVYKRRGHLRGVYRAPTRRHQPRHAFAQFFSYAPILAMADKDRWPSNRNRSIPERSNRLFKLAFDPKVKDGGVGVCTKGADQ
jgi:hypothetical protein